MKLSSQEEYGLRCLLHLARQGRGESLTIPEIGEAEGISSHNVAKYLRLLRQAGFVDSERGQHGGYTLSREPSAIVVDEVLAALGSRLYDSSFCDNFVGTADICHHSTIDCSIRGLWIRVQNAVDEVLSQTTLQDLLRSADVLKKSAAVRSEQLLQVSSS